MEPQDLLQEAQRREVGLIAITDHDTIDGYAACRGDAAQAGVRLLPGIELNTDGPHGEVHILGYGFDPDSPVLQGALARRRQERLDWAQEIVHQLGRLGMEVPFEECLQRARGGVVVRTHIAETLATHGYGSDPEALFSRYLAKGAPAYVPRPTFTAEDAIRLIQQAGGIAILAHPGIYRFEVAFSRFVESGIDGVEVYYSKHTEAQTEHWKRIADHHHLIVSGGSDFHGHGSRNPFPIGSVMIPPEVKEWWYWFTSRPHYCGLTR
ncbi:PHP domain-containing protein [Brevibacillus humidisoli]|uniref:PHP domain-containing protein n=1 Tax=Brevibacillus humidisoli TaxID=2895522 RepID=UPI001E465ECF|nr:PHP domain-containing protein [Brevibacillus humidisoli]